MHPSLRSLLCGLGILASLSFAAGCSQGEGERCQITSDCASGLVCDGAGSTGNGVCRKTTSANKNDAATEPGPGEDASVSTPDTEPSLGEDSAVSTPDTEPATVDGQPAGIDAQPSAVDVGGAIDGGAIDTGAID
jgi:hypothetical protein